MMVTHLEHDDVLVVHLLPAFYVLIVINLWNDKHLVKSKKSEISEVLRLERSSIPG